MHIRPRCREFLPLAGQQLRLRNLVRIHGFNIECTSSNSLIYYTLHQTRQSVEFYRSEPLPARQKNQKWSEIACMEMLKANLNSICVKVWEKFESIDMTYNRRNLQPKNQHANQETTIKELKNSLFQKHLFCNPPAPQMDKLLFTWGVYFSGLIPAKQEMHYLPNSLIFQLHGECFASAEHFESDTLRDLLKINYKQFYSGVPKAGISPSDNLSINSPEVCRHLSPMSFDEQLKDKPKRDLLTMSKARYINLQCLRVEVRCSYDLKKLLEIQEMQRLLNKKSSELLKISLEIKQRCVHSITSEQLTLKKRTRSPSTSVLQQQHSMGQTLSLLLSNQQQQNDPKVLLRVQQLQKLIESIRSKQRLLQTECDTYNESISHLRIHLSALSDARQQMQTSLKERRKKLDLEKKDLEETCRCLQSKLQLKRHVIQNVERRMSSLCMELRDIYPIKSICGIPYAQMDAYLNDVRYGIAQAANVTPMALSASLGYVAHLVQMMAVIFSRPLRNPIRHEGSRSRIVDIGQDLRCSSQEFPLYSRSTILSKHVKYAIRLLNQNIIQLYYDITGVRRDHRATIGNILHIFTALSKVEQNATGGDTQQRIVDSFSNSHSSLDLNISASKLSPITTLVPSSHPMLIAGRHLSHQSYARVCRSVGSYSDCEDDFKDIIEHCYSNSDSNITNQKFTK